MEWSAVAEISILASAVEALLPSSQRNELPTSLLTHQTARTLFTPQWVFTYSPSARHEAAAGWSGSRKTGGRAGRPGWGVIFYDHASGWEADEGMKIAAAKLGMDYVGYEVIPFLGTLDTSTELLRIAPKEVDIIFVAACAASFVTLVKDAARLDIQEKGIMLLGYPYGIDEAPLDIVGEDGGGWYRVGVYPLPVERDLPGMDTVFEAAKKYRGSDPEEVAGYFVKGWTGTMVTV